MLSKYSLLALESSHASFRSGCTICWSTFCRCRYLHRKCPPSEVRSMPSGVFVYCISHSLKTAGLERTSLLKPSELWRSLCKSQLAISEQLLGEKLLHGLFPTFLNTLSTTSVLIYRPSLQAHRFRTPHIIAIGYLLFSVLVTIYLWTWMSRENKRRDLVLSQEKGDAEVLTIADRQRLGDRDLHYRYVI